MKNEPYLENSNQESTENAPVFGTHVQVIEEYHSGPLPSPDILLRYENITPGFAERIMVMAEKQSQHRRDIERTTCNANARNSTLGIISAAFVVLAIPGIIVLSGNATAGAWVGGIGLAALAGTFVQGTRIQRRDKQRQDEQSE